MGRRRKRMSIESRGRKIVRQRTSSELRGKLSDRKKEKKVT